jgi:hypothetical protein
MGSEFWQAAGQIFGTVASVVIIVGAFKVGGTYKGVVRDVAETKDSCSSIKTTLEDHSPRILKIEQTLHGPQGQNGMYGAVRELQITVQEIKEQLVGPADRRSAPRGKPDRRRKSA